MTGLFLILAVSFSTYLFCAHLYPGYPLPWEDDSYQYPVQFAPPLEVAIAASNGASDYGNKFGEPVLAGKTCSLYFILYINPHPKSILCAPSAGFARSFGLRLPSGERREWVKPIMFSGGIGSMEDIHQKKEKPEAGEGSDLKSKTSSNLDS